MEKIVQEETISFNGVEAPKNENDHYTIRYAEFVVPLVKAVQELSAKVESQQRKINLLLSQLEKGEAIDNTPASRMGSLLQNNPNPFSMNTEIKMSLSETVHQANIIVFNLEGKELKNIQVNGRGTTAVTISANELSAGMYIYVLIADGLVVGTKRMILTK